MSQVKYTMKDKKRKYDFYFESIKLIAGGKKIVWLSFRQMTMQRADEL